MSSLSIQFFATTDEVASFARKWLEGGALHAAVVEYHPFSVLPITLEDVEEHVRRERVRRLVLAERPVDCSAQGNNQLLDKNEGALVLDIGRTSAFGMTESRISTINSTRAWRLVASDLKRSTTAGMVGANEQSGATAKYRTLRYTQGAAKLEESGTPMRPFEKSPVRLRPDR